LGGAGRPVRVREPLDPDLVVTALRLLPSRGWTAGLFGRRDKALLALAASTDLPYRELAVMTAGQLDIVDGAAGVTDSAGEMHVIDAVADAVLCGPCALTRWRRIIDVEVTTISAARMRYLLKKPPSSPRPADTCAGTRNRSTTKRWPCRCSRRSTSGGTSHYQSTR